MMEDRIEAMAKAQQEAGFLDGAAETGQSWNVICRIFDQIVETVGEERLSGRALRQIVEAGLAEMEIGIVPVNPDSVLGGDHAANQGRQGEEPCWCSGANEGLLPLQKTDEGLLSEAGKGCAGRDGSGVFQDGGHGKAGGAAGYLQDVVAAGGAALCQLQPGSDETGGELRPSAVFRELENFLQSRAESDDSGRPGRSGGR